MKMARTCIAAIISAFALVEFLFWGAPGTGFSFLFLILLAAYYVACGFPRTSIRHMAEHTALAVSAAALALSYTFFASEVLRAINFLALIFLMGLLFLHGTAGRSIKWDKPVFQAELWIGYLVRPFVCIASPWKEFAAMRSKRKNIEAGAVRKSPRRRILVQVITALLAAVPLLLLLLTILSSSDPIFRSVFAPLADMIRNLKIDVLAGKVLVFVLLMPFVASSVWSYRDRYTVSKSAAEEIHTKYPLVPPASSITVLGLVNALYLLYAVIQFAYLFGVWTGNLPEGLTPAQYARNGFFELAFISCINVVLLLLSIRVTQRKGKTGRLIRILSVSLLVLSFVQLGSAFLRMRLYILAFGFTLLRYFVLAFMILIAVYFVFLLLREFFISFPLFRCMIFAGTAALILLNYSVPDARIAQYNINHYQSKELSSLDTEYIMNGLSADGTVILFEKEDELSQENKEMQSVFDNIHALAQSSEYNYRKDNWKMYNGSQEKLYQWYMTQR